MTDPIRRWHVGLVADLKAGKPVGIEAAAAIENLEDQLFAAETALAEQKALADETDPPPLTNEQYRHVLDHALGKKA